MSTWDKRDLFVIGFAAGGLIMWVLILFISVATCGQ